MPLLASSVMNVSLGVWRDAPFGFRVLDDRTVDP
jgi:hypothetical protein